LTDVQNKSITQIKPLRELYKKTTHTEKTKDMKLKPLYAIWPANTLGLLILQLLKHTFGMRVKKNTGQ